MCGKDDTKIAVYNLEECTERKKTGIPFLSWRKPHKTKNLICSKDKFDNLICVKPSWIVKFSRFSSGINLVLLSMLNKFTVWAVRVWSQSGFGINTISVPTGILSFTPNSISLKSSFKIRTFCYIVSQTRVFCCIICKLGTNTYFS